MKQVIVVRSDLKMGKGKIAAQAAHASLSAAEMAQRKPAWYEVWKEEGQAKVVLRTQSEAELRELFQRAKRAGLPAALVEDRGLTQVEPGTVTCLGIGPGPDGEIDAITGNLRLL
ncbi:MAG: peptidyl-tRNA hydrolase [Nitrososphaerota archaeon]|jgi:PTH2 family peptidyl-tRNA hydrolase|nr:peptidyl-tRNA hydrolase [Nitrososphaerota archaeon]MDG6962224.1 peptidyl-tRNA hydrolase [Nitrososphaerota archaeon]MDG6963896.1 peptidyl-tRNA hydrolase [Nitrososphaerota archaeon]MDG6974609.1 peptidyl-tRNA hydrolase [Nitrososphaerota archaeon]MDG7010396.1 peptidyl-tRNA hydrolase [Nitrososphaerota archaeon]